MEAVTLAMLLDSDSGSEEAEELYDDMLRKLALAYRLTIPQPTQQALVELLSYPGRSFVADFRMHRESFLVLVNLLYERG